MHSTDGIRAAVDTVGRELALGPAPEYRKCPHCGGTGMRAATLCSTCWEKLVPPPSSEVGHWGQAT